MSGERRHKRVEELEGAQRAAATAVGNVVVAAGAGSGKTTVLAARYVHLLETGKMASGRRVHARNILVLTFTRKAAAEMYARIYGALAEAAALAAAAARTAAPAQTAAPAKAEVPAPGEAAELAAHLELCLSEFSQAQISTFDAFAARIARSGCARFGLAPDFAVDVERARDMAKELALSFILEHREEEAIRDLVSAAGLEGAREEALAGLAVGRMSLSSPPDFAAFHALQSARLRELEDGARSTLLAMRSAALDHAGLKTTATSQAWLDALGREPGESEGELLAFIAGLDGLRKPSSGSTDEASSFLSDAVPDIRKAAASYRDIAATMLAHPGRLALYRLLDEFREKWEALRRAEKVLTFRDVAQLALDVLEGDGVLLEHYRGLYRFLMIDEFQDDDELQKKVLFHLAGQPGGPARGPARLATDRLFFVGDEKQSIYLFRGADVSVFRRLAAELAAEEGGVASALPLSMNFRSEPGVIAMVNAIFPTVMAPREGLEELEDFEAGFEPLASRQPTPGVKPLFVYLELPREARPGAPGDSADLLRDSAEAEAWEIARIVREAVEGGSLMVADRLEGRARPARYEDFALLLRSTGHQVHYEKYFRLFDIPYSSENSCGLFSEAVACDLYYALRLALYPRERNALAAYLRSPFAGLSDEGLVRLLASPLEPFHDAEGPSEAEALLPARDSPAWARGLACHRALTSMTDRAPIAACLSYLWFEAGYRAALLSQGGTAAFEEHFELLHTMAVEADARGESLAAFVARLEPLVGRPDKLEIALPREGLQGVRIMTIHKSKGLEFPVVIVPQANNVGEDRAARDFWYWEEALGPSFRPPASMDSRSRNAFFESARERRAAMEGAELKRLLYVALTRAESHIIVTATEPRNEDARGRSFRSLLAGPLDLLGPGSPLAQVEAETGRGGGPLPLELPPFGQLVPLPSGALVGLIPERSEVQYLGLMAGAKSRARAGRGEGSEGPPQGCATVERRAAQSSVSVSVLATRYAELAASQESPAPPETLDIAEALAPPPSLAPETWGSLVHALLEQSLGPSGGDFRLAGALREALEEALGSEAALRGAVERAKKLAQVFLGSELGRRALASRERHVELKVAIGLGSGPGAEPQLQLQFQPPASRMGPRVARGSIDLAFVEAGRVVVVDYKTDASIAAGSHDLQVAAYKRAAAEIFGMPAEAWVFYLYGGGKAIQVDQDGGAARLEDAPAPLPSPPPSFGRLA